MTGDPATQIRWPERVSVENLAAEIARIGGFGTVTLETFPDYMRDTGVSGVTLARDGNAEVFVNPGLTDLNRKLTILHEYAHILHGDLAAEDEYAIMHRSVFDDPREKRAEETGMRLLFEIQQREHDTDVLRFIGGGPGE